MMVTRHFKIRYSEVQYRKPGTERWYSYFYMGVTDRDEAYNKFLMDHPELETMEIRVRVTD